MVFCFSLALLHLSIGHFIVLTRTRDLKFLARLGLIGMLFGMYGVVLSQIASNEFRPIPLYMPCLYMLAGGFVLNFIFGSYEGSVIKSIMESVKNIISVILGITNVFSDIMSYLRLWAVGIAGASIAGIVISKSLPLIQDGSFLVIFGVLLFVVGTMLNLTLNVLAVLVHAVRLNTLEFSGAIGLTWSGFEYKPFSKAKR
jgi:V/A-type H+-transporting ATPase subunit I